MPPTDLQRLALTDDVARQPTFWRGPATLVDGALHVAPGGTLDLGTWFNAAPVGWWRELLGPGHLRLRVRGRGTLTVWSSRGGARETVERRAFDGTFETHLPRTEGIDWYWVTIDAGSDGGVLDAVEWVSGGGLGRNGGRSNRVTVVVPTYRREDDCLAQLRRLTAPGLAETVGRVVLVDQGDSFAAHPGVGEVLAEAGERVVLVEQANLGGSGGYSRGMVESLRWPGDPVLLLDDDAEIEPESLRRLHVLSNLATSPTVLGTALLSAEEPTTLTALAEGVRRSTFRWGPVDGVGDGVDVASGTPDAWRFTRPSDRSEYTGWWGTLLPAGAVERLGLAAPYFLKWDDAEYGLRARTAGLHVATLPGPAVWHPTFAAKGTISSWSAWPLHRNRLATAAAYGAGRGVLGESFVHQVKHVLSLQYDTAELWNAAIAEVLDGPGWMSGDLTAVRPRAQALLDAVEPREVPAGARAVTLPGPAAFGWQVGLRTDAVVFTDGSTRNLVRDRARGRRAVRATLGLHWRALRSWGRLRRDYRRALAEATTQTAWSARFGD